MDFFEKYTREELQKIVSESTSIREVLLKLNHAGSGSNHTNLKLYLINNNFDMSTLVGRAIKRVNTPQQHLASILVENGTANSSKLKRRLIKEGVKPNKCEICGISEWRGEKLALELHHINGVHTDNRLENLIILCPNCHSLTTNFRKSNYKEEKNRMDAIMKNIANKTANEKMPLLIQECIELKNKPKLKILEYQRRKKSTEEKDNKPKNICIQCGKETTNKRFCCLKCSIEYTRRNVPSKEKLLELSKQVHSISELNRLLNLGVTDNAIVKWFKNYGIYEEAKKNFMQKQYTILQYNLDNEFIKEWKNSDELESELGIKKCHIHSCCRGEQKTSHGYIWKYKKDMEDMA